MVLTNVEGPVDGYKVSKAREGFVCLNTFKVEHTAYTCQGTGEILLQNCGLGQDCQRSPRIFEYVLVGCL